jgi:hypothetical protein
MEFSIPRGGTPRIGEAGTWVRADGDGLRHPVAIRLQVADDGRLLVTGLLIEADHELIARDLRFPIGRIVAAFSAAMGRPATLKRLFRELLGSDLVLEGDIPEALPPEWRKLLLPPTDAPRRTRPGPHVHDDAFYQRLAEDYRQALRTHPQRPIRALMKARGYSEPTIHRQLREARRRGFLPATTRGRPSARKEP